MSNFDNLGLSLPLVGVLEKMGFTTPTPIQEQSIPYLLEDGSKDFIGMASTGTGKTAAFGLPLIELVNEEASVVQALVLCPTRELCQQTTTQLTTFSSAVKRLNVEPVYGGASITNQIKQLKRAVQIVVATPGRLLDLLERKAIHLDHVRYVVLDEADEMLNMGFKEDIDAILSNTRDDRATWLFSATMPSEIRKIVKKYMTSPMEVSVTKGKAGNTDISHKYVVTKKSNKIPALRRFMDIQPDMRGIMFCRTKKETQEIADKLGNMGYGVEALHGDLSQAQRDIVMQRFKKRAMQLLIATDVAARGIDVSDLTHVVHHTLPDQTESYTHRSGRTGRAGKTGVSLALVNSGEERRIRSLEKALNTTFERIDIPTIAELRASRIDHWAELIQNTKTDKQADEILQRLSGKLAHLDQEELLKRMITSQLDHLMAKGSEEEDLNAYAGERNKGAAAVSGKKRYYVNIGLIDGLTEGDLLHFLGDVSGLGRATFSNVEMKKNCSYVLVDSDKDGGLEDRFKGVEIDGRSIRVNLDNEPFERRRDGSSDKKSGYKGKPERRKRRPEKRKTRQRR